jgi:hypothetical protein
MVILMHRDVRRATSQRYDSRILSIFSTPGLTLPQTQEGAYGAAFNARGRGMPRLLSLAEFATAPRMENK